MAYGKRLNLTFQDDDDVAWTTEIYQDGYEDPSTEIVMGGDPVVMNWNGNRWKNIIGSECTITILSSADLSWLDTSDGTEIKVIILKAGSTWWTGYAVPDQYYDSLGAYPREFIFTASDRLGMLDKFNYVDGSDLPYEGFESAIVILAQALAFTEVALDINSADNLFDTGMDTAATDDPLEQFSVDQEVVIDNDLNPGSCYDIIQYILGAKQLMLFQSAGVWWIYRVPNLENASMAYRVFNSSGVYQSNSSITHGVITNNSTFRLLAKGLLETAPSYRNILMVQDYHKKKQPFLGWNFPLNEFVSTTVLKHWIQSGSTSGWTQYQNGDNYMIHNFFGPNSFDITKSIETPAIPVESESQRLFKFKYASTALGPVTLKVAVLLSGGPGYSLQSDGSWLTPAISFIELTPPIGSSNDLTEFSLLCDIPPVDGNVSIAFYKPFSDNANSVWVDDVEFTIVPNPFVVNNYPGTATFDLDVNADNDKELTYYQNLSDTPIDNDQTEYTGFLKNITTGLYTSSWQEDGAGADKTLQLWLRELNAPAGLANIYRMRARIVGDTDFHKTVILKEQNDITFVWEAVSFHIKTVTWDGNAIQLEGIYLSGDARSGGASGSGRGRPSTTGGISGGGATPAEPNDRRSAVEVELTSGDNNVLFSSPLPVDSSYTLRVLALTTAEGWETRGTITNKTVAGFDINVDDDCTMEYDANKVL